MRHICFSQIFKSGKFFGGEHFPSSTDSRRASCQLLAKELALNTGKLPPGGLPKNNVVKQQIKQTDLQDS